MSCQHRPACPACSGGSCSLPRTRKRWKPTTGGSSTWSGRSSLTRSRGRPRVGSTRQHASRNRRAVRPVACPAAPGLLQLPDAGVYAGPAVAPALVGVDVPTVPAGPGETPGADYPDVAVDVHGHLVDSECGQRVTLQVGDVPLLVPHFSGRPVEI